MMPAAPAGQTSVQIPHLVHFFWLLRTPSGVNQPLWTGSHASRLSSKIEGDHSGKPLPAEGGHVVLDFGPCALRALHVW